MVSILVTKTHQQVTSTPHAVDESIRCIAQGPSRWVKIYNGYFVNGFKFHTTQYGQHKSTMNSGVCILGSSWGENEVDYYGLLAEVLELEYFGMGNKVVLFKCHWYDISDRGVKVHPRFGLVEINVRRGLKTNDPFILARQAQQVYYTIFSSTRKDRCDWRAVCKIKARSRINIPLAEIEVEYNEETAQDPFQEEIMPFQHDIPIAVELDQPDILLDTTANPDEVSSSEVEADLRPWRRNIRVEEEEEEEDESEIANSDDKDD